MKKRLELGQHFLVSPAIAKTIVDSLQLTKDDTVLEIGTGRGILIPFLCKETKNVISIEADKELFLQAKEKFSHLSNLSLQYGDGFKSKSKFTVFVSNLPYSKSRKAMEWLVQKKFSRAVVMVQKEFAEKLDTKSGKNRKAISIIASYAAEIEHLQDVKKGNFVPEPKVNSSIIRLTQKRIVTEELIHLVNKLFSYRRKTIQNIFKQFGMEIKSNKRLDELNNDEIIRIAKKILQK